jgi:glycosyltransferase involved in cell wall biosynthesis
MKSSFMVLNAQDSELVSIIIPNYNHGDFVAGAIQSVLVQDYQDIEIIVVDDGSTDNSHEIVAQFGDKVRYIWQENQGLSAARNTGIHASIGTFISVLDADDLYEPGYLSSMISVLQSQPDADGIFCGYQFVDENNQPLPQIEARSIPETDLYEALLDGNFLVPESMLLRRYCYENVGDFDPNLTACEDWDMWLRVSRQYNIINTRQILTRHRVLEGSMSSDPLRMLRNRLAVLDKHIGPPPKTDYSGSSLERRSYARAYLGSCVEYLQYGDHEKAFECLKNMAGFYPALLTELDTLYQLACGDQPKGSMGDFKSIDLEHNSHMLINMLNRLFDDDKLRDSLIKYYPLAYANAYFALGLLNYGARRFQIARRNLNNALKYDLSFGTQRKFFTLWLKTFVSPQLIDNFRKLHQTKFPT